MTPRWIVDTGPLVALLSKRDGYHGWALETFAGVNPPALTCEAVLAEAWHLLSGTAKGQTALLDLIAAGTLAVDFALIAELAPVRRLVARYRDRPMSLADACLVRLAELFDDAAVITLDRDFSVYRKHGRQTIPQVSPGADGRLEIEIAPTPMHLKRRGKGVVAVALSAEMPALTSELVRDTLERVRR